jgi:hypothetical protein
MFAYDDADKQAADKALAQAKLWQPINDLLRKLTVCDPACGSGSFIVGMLMVVDDLQARANKQLGIAETMYQRRKRIIGQSLYGVDVKDWAVRTAELRLWLQLIVETDLDAAEMKVRPLLPNLSFKLRVGDSLVQQVGGIIFNVDHAHSIIPAPLKRKLTTLKEEKWKFYNDVRSSKFKSEEAVRKEELNIFREILDTRKDDLDKRIHDLKRELAKPPEQMSLLGMETPKAAEQLDLFMKAKREDLENTQEELAEIESARAALRTTQDVPFVWDIAFVEIFEDDEKGFGIMVGNPPYVRQEMIADPMLNEADFKPDAWRETKKEYKQQLQQAVAEAFPKFFNYKHGSDKFRTLDGKSDLYIYFYLLGLKRVNPNGSFCFITSNSWLDVGYGKDLQEFLLTQAHVKMILDNQAKRSFKNADVNTIIALFASPTLTKSESAEKTARFVMFRTPFENVLSPVVFQEIEQTRERKSTPEFRVTPIRQQALLAEGMVISEDEEGTQKRGLATATYQGDKWGGRYLRAPDIFFIILEKGKDKLVRLDQIASVRFGIKTGANEFFYLGDNIIKEWGIEQRFIKPVIKSPRECHTIIVQPQDLESRILICHESKSDLRGTGILEYIKWGERQGYDKRPTCRGRSQWWSLDAQNVGDFLWFKAFNDRFLVPRNVGLPSADRFYTIVLNSQNKKNHLCATFTLNCTLTHLMTELNGRVNLGEGALDNMTYEAARVQIIDPNLIRQSNDMPVFSRAIEPCATEVIKRDRRAMDDVVFDALKLTRGERDAVYEAVVELVKKRLEKAGSV